MKHTPGPWLVDDGKRDGLLMVYADAGGMPGIIVNQGRIEARDRANARLIAASPELLDVVMAFIAETSDYMKRNHLGDPEQQHNVKWARAIIAKIEGRK